MYSSPYSFRSCCAMLYTIIIQLSISCIIQAYFHIIAFRIFCFWSSGSWTHLLTSLFEFRKFILILGTQKVKNFLTSTYIKSMLRNEILKKISVLSPKILRLPRPAGRIWLGKYLLRVVRVGLLNSAARGLPCLLLSLLSLLRCGAVCLALSASMPACAVCVYACAVLWYYVRLCLGSWCCASCPCCALCMLCLYVCNIISLCYALLYGYIGYKNRACCRLNICGGAIYFVSMLLY